MTTSWRKKLASLHSVGRKLEDGAMYIIDLEDMCPAGVLVQAYKQETSDRYTLSVSEGEVGRGETCSEKRRLYIQVDYKSLGIVFKQQNSHLRQPPFEIAPSCSEYKA